MHAHAQVPERRVNSGEYPLEWTLYCPLEADPGDVQPCAPLSYSSGFFTLLPLPQMELE
jgi:hypothetical protein